MRFHLPILLVACGAAFAVDAFAKDLEAGAAAVELRPPDGIAMAGFGARVGVSHGTLDPLHANVLVFAAADHGIALVTLGLVRLLPASQRDHFRPPVKSSANIGDVILNASHTPSGPALKDGPPAWQSQAADDI